MANPRAWCPKAWTDMAASGLGGSAWPGRLTGAGSSVSLLVATAIGLFAAIPAVVAYNRFSHDVNRIAVRFESFMEEFSNILQRQAHIRQA